MSQLSIILRTIRIKNWIKNILILVPVCFSFIPITKNLVLGFIDIFLCISILASIVYIINDIVDLKNDRKDLIKKKRPLASGQITKKNSLLICLVLSIFLFIYIFIKNNNSLNIILISYFFLNLSYTFFFKNFFLLDVIVLSFFYIIRVVAPIYYFNLTFSNWSIAIIFSATLLVGFGKRYMDIQNNQNNNDFSSLYKKKELVILISFFAIILQILFFLFSTSTVASQKFGEFYYLSSFIVFFGTARYLFSLFKRKFSDPVEIFINDKLLLCFVILFTIFSVYSIYNI